MTVWALKGSGTLEITLIYNTLMTYSTGCLCSTGKSLSEALIFASTNPQYDGRLFIELQIQNMKIPSSEHGENMLYTEIVFDY